MGPPNEHNSGETSIRLIPSGEGFCDSEHDKPAFTHTLPLFQPHIGANAPQLAFVKPLPPGTGRVAIKEAEDSELQMVGA